MNRDFPENEAAVGIGTALLCNELGDPVVSVLTEDDVWTISQLQDAEEEPMLRDAA